ncbi:MAG TPA: hypothetical protein PLK31_15150 [Chloroflexota bacterium]|nr:hypothetical protein [Chloroflexota bacterium]
MGNFLHFSGCLRREPRRDKWLNEPHERRPVVEIASFAGEDVGEGAAEFRTAVVA